MTQANLRKMDSKLSELEKKIFRQLIPVRKMWDDGVFDSKPKQTKTKPKS